MKSTVYIAFIIFLSGQLFGQQWRDSLEFARTAYQSKDYQKAYRLYQSSQKLAPKEYDFSDEIAQSAYKAREFKKAEEVYNQSSSSSKADQIKKAKTYHNLGNARMQQKNYQGAVESYKESLRNNPTDEQTRYNLSEAIRRLKDQQKKNDDQQKKDDPANNPAKDQKNKNNKENNKSGDKDQPQKDPPKSGEGDQQNKSTLPNKTVDRMLDKLAKQESETKRKVAGNKGEKGVQTSGKDW